jgi:hypothetical protein
MPLPPAAAALPTAAVPVPAPAAPAPPVAAAPLDAPAEVPALEPAPSFALLIPSLAPLQPSLPVRIPCSAASGPIGASAASARPLRRSSLR